MNIINPLVSEYLEGLFLPIDETMDVMRKQAEERHRRHVFVGGKDANDAALFLGIIRKIVAHTHF